VRHRQSKLVLGRGWFFPIHYPLFSEDKKMNTTQPTTNESLLDNIYTKHFDQDGMLKCLQELIQIPSITGTKEESYAQQWFADKLKSSGFETDLWQIDLESTYNHVDFPGIEVQREEAWGLVGTWGGNEGKTLVLNGHIDVVPPGDLNQWEGKNPFSGYVAGGLVYGRGACDMKAGLVCNLYAVKAVQSAGIELKGKLLLESVASEEDGGLGTFATLLRGYRGDAAIITEPTSLNIVAACAGALTFRLIIKGLSAHASNRLDGVSAIEKFWLIFKALQELEAKRNHTNHPLMQDLKLPYPLSIGIVRAGDWASSVPDSLIADGRIGVALGEDPANARRELEEAVAHVCAQDEWLRANPVVVDWFGGQFASGETPSEHPLLGLVSDAHQFVDGRFPRIHGAPYGSDLRLMVGLGGVPTVHYGPGGVRQAHAPNEYVSIDEMVTTTKTLIKVILDYCEVNL
jgi:acetylornithine deacetylase